MFQGVGLLSPKHSLQLPPLHSSPRRARPTKHGKNVKNARLLLLPASDTPTPAFQLRLRGDRQTGPRMRESKPREVRRLHRLLQLKRLLVNVSLAWKHSLLAKPKRWLSCESVYFCECVCVYRVFTSCLHNDSRGRSCFNQIQRESKVSCVSCLS